MLVADAQKEVRSVYLGGSIGQLISGLIWLGSAGLATFLDPKTGFWALAIGGAAIFPLTVAALRLSGRKAYVDRSNPLGDLGMQIAFTIPIVLPLAGIAAMNRLGWFYPACLIIVGAHYLPFVFLYGMRAFAWLGGVMIVSGFWIGRMADDRVVLGGWVGGAILVSFAPILFAVYKRSDLDPNDQVFPTADRTPDLSV